MAALGTYDSGDSVTIDSSALALESGGNLAASATVLGTTADASIDSDAAGTIKGALRGLAKAFFARIPASLGPKAPSQSLSVTLAVSQGAEQTEVDVPQTTAAAIVASSTPCNGVMLWAPDGSGGATAANTDNVFVGSSALSLAKGVVALKPGDSVTIPCSDAHDVFSVCATTGQHLRLAIL